MNIRDKIQNSIHKSIVDSIRSNIWCSIFDVVRNSVEYRIWHAYGPSIKNANYVSHYDSVRGRMIYVMRDYDSKEQHESVLKELLK